MKTKIVIFGLGGVGGYYGGMLSHKYENDPEIEVYFVARGQHLQAIKEKGLKVITEDGSFVTHPTLATDNVSEIGTADYIIISTKSYDLDASIEQLKPCVGADTVILPLLNGIDNTTRIRRMLPDTEVWYGCTYIVGRLNAPGVIESSGNIHLVHFGYENWKTDVRLRFMEQVMKDAGFDARLSFDILSVIWKKFFFISSTASLTSYFDVSFGALLTDDTRRSTLTGLLNELLEVAHAEGANVDSSVIDDVIRQLEDLPFETTSSMHTDFKAGRSTELNTLTGIVIELARKHGIDTPIYNKVYAGLKKKATA
ncbi:2-dehydropantoate 2-reductase [Paludibacter sp. 221]|uniref:ketopantoate reductase family protein n=1 Tax=Paludibacter sp. 221 TaxID=2302939 RepID=UPI0013D4ED8A|nr:2-dehydropantoate 2-reductase [Paludibacter sp. 221]NDV47737.1 2-dehydropantoate 2-reductase [Paludibacter sp. 221]